MDEPLIQYSAEEARALLLENGVTAPPGLKVLADAAFLKVFSGRKADGVLWKITKVEDDRFTVEY